MPIDKQKEKRLKERIEDARASRNKLATHINEFYRLAVPLRKRLNTKAHRGTETEDDQYDIFDNTLQEAVEDFASMQADSFVPDYRPWVELVPGSAFESTSDEKNFEKAKDEYQDRLYRLIRQTEFYEQQHEVFTELAGSAGGVNIPLEMRLDRPIRCRPIMMPNLLFDEGAFNDLDGRWTEMVLRKGVLPETFPGVDFDAIPSLRNKRADSEVEIVFGNYRDDTVPGGPFRWMLMVDNKIVEDRESLENAGPSIIVARWRHNPPNPWGPGPSQLALPAANVLDELGYLNLKKLGKEADPPYTYEEDGVFNPEGGIDAGTMIARRQGSDAPDPMYSPTSSQSLYFDREKYQMSVRRALFVEEPLPRGKTPPTKAEYISELARKERRMMARRRVYREYVLPCLRRFAFVFAARGELDPIRIDGREIGVEFISPMSKASDADEVSSGVTLAESFVGVSGEGGAGAINWNKTLANWKAKLGDTTIELNEEADV